MISWPDTLSSQERDLHIFADAYLPCRLETYWAPVRVDLGNGEHNYKGELIPINGLDIGDSVYYNQNSGTDIEDEDGEKYLLLNTKSVLAIKG